MMKEFIRIAGMEQRTMNLLEAYGATFTPVYNKGSRSEGTRLPFCYLMHYDPSSIVFTPTNYKCLFDMLEREQNDGHYEIHCPYIITLPSGKQFLVRYLYTAGLPAHLTEEQRVHCYIIDLEHAER